jgi:hypothetical protein
MTERSYSNLAAGPKFGDHFSELLGLLQERYGHAKEQAEREINDWARRLKAYSAAELTDFAMTSQV